MRRNIDAQFPAVLPEDIDPCGEAGELHTFVWDGLIFTQPLAVQPVRIAKPGPHAHCDLTLVE